MSYLDEKSEKKNIHLQDFPFLFLEDHVNGKEIREKSKMNTSKRKTDKFNIISELFFSLANKELINKKLVLEVFKLTKIRIPFQKDTSISSFMGDIFYDYSRNLPFDVKKQINELNNKVVKNIIPIILTSLDQKINYLQEISQRKKLIPLPENVQKDYTNRGSANIFFDR